MIGTPEAGLHPCSQPISVLPGARVLTSTWGVRATLGEAGRGCGQTTRLSRGWPGLANHRLGAQGPAGEEGQGCLAVHSPGREVAGVQQGDDDIWS